MYTHTVIIITTTIINVSIITTISSSISSIILTKSYIIWFARVGFPHYERDSVERRSECWRWILHYTMLLCYVDCMIVYCVIPYCTIVYHTVRGVQHIACSISHVI